MGKSLPQGGRVRRFGYVNGPARKPKRRLFELLKSQGMQANQQMIFISDGGDTVRDLPLYLHPQSEHLLDWFHVAMRLTVLGQLAKGIPEPSHVPAKAAALDGEDEDELEEEILGRRPHEIGE